MNSNRKRHSDDIEDVPRVKKQKESVKESNEASCDNETTFKELNAYLLWFEQFYANKKTEKMYLTMKEPLKNMINMIDFKQLSNIWIDSVHILLLIEEKCAILNMQLIKVIALNPKIGQIAYKKSRLLTLYSSVFYNDPYRYDEESEDESNGGSPMLHIQSCRIEFLIGNTQKTTQGYRQLLGLSHDEQNQENICDGWIINPKWQTLCSCLRN